MKKTLVLIVILISKLTFGQSFLTKETEEILKFLLTQDSISNTVLDTPINITDYEFDGDYSLERIFPDASANTVICVVPIEFESSIHSVLKEIDTDYDSSYYQTQIKEINQIFWKERKLDLNKKTKFIKWKWRRLYKETSEFSVPIFSKNRQLAIIKFSSINSKSMHEKRPQILILENANNEWNILTIINSLNNWE